MKIFNVIILSIILSVYGCGKDDPAAPAAASKSKVKVKPKSIEQVSKQVSGKSLKFVDDGTYESCSLDDETIFKVDGTFENFVNTKCSPEETDTTGTWIVFSDWLET